MKYYAGIGARATPVDVLKEMKLQANLLFDAGYTLRSGGANGADTAFESAVELAADSTPSLYSGKQIFLPWPGFNGRSNCTLSRPSEKAFELAQQFSPFWFNLKPATKKLYARNMHQILGANLDSPVEFVLCWTPDGAETEAEYQIGKTGGTGIAIVMADRIGIPVINMNKDGWQERLDNILNSGE